MSQFMNVNVAYVYVENWEAAKHFYKELLGWPVAYEDDKMGWLEFGEPDTAHFAISWWQGEGHPVRGVGTTIVFGVKNVDEVVRMLRSRGVKCDDPDHIPGVVTLGTFYDPEGNRLQMASEG